jgi:three-Cys-motif partner protein
MRDSAGDDGLVTPEIGRWGKRKYHFLKRYLDLFSTGMKHHWPKRYYIDLFSSSGRARIRDTNEIVTTSALLAAEVSDPFTRLILCEREPDLAEALRRRLASLTLPNPPVVVQGDANRCISELLGYVPRTKALAVTFADPYGLHLDFETVRAIAAYRSDLIVLLPDRMDALRNWAKYYYDNPNSNLDRFMGEPGWREVLLDSSQANSAERLRSRYLEQLRTLGYEHFGQERVSNDRGTEIYMLIFASRHPRGLDFWNKAKSIDESGQRSLDFS